jgi:hypothetical protein
MSRLSAIKDCDDETVLAAYTYLGLGTIVTEDYTTANLNLDYAGTTTGSLPGFDRVVIQICCDSGDIVPRSLEKEDNTPDVNFGRLHRNIVSIAVPSRCFDVARAAAIISALAL